MNKQVYLPCPKEKDTMRDYVLMASERPPIARVFFF